MIKYLFHKISSLIVSIWRFFSTNSNVKNNDKKKTNGTLNIVDLNSKLRLSEPTAITIVAVNTYCAISFWRVSKFLILCFSIFSASIFLVKPPIVS